MKLINKIKCLFKGHDPKIIFGKPSHTDSMLHTLFCAKCEKIFSRELIKTGFIWKYQDLHRYQGGKKAGVKVDLYREVLGQWLGRIKALNFTQREKLINNSIKFCRCC